MELSEFNQKLKEICKENKALMKLEGNNGIVSILITKTDSIGALKHIFLYTWQSNFEKELDNLKKAVKEL